MCEIFPEVSNFCLCLNIRMGMLIISVLAVMSGVTLLCIVEQRSAVSFGELKNITDINSPDKILSQTSNIIRVGLSGMSAIFMFTGVVLLVATVSDQEGLVQVFVWVTFINVIVGFLLVVAVAYECVFKETCILESLDWLSGAALLVAVVGYLFVWIYFIIVANSYILNM